MICYQQTSLHSASGGGGGMASKCALLTIGALKNKKSNEGAKHHLKEEEGKVTFSRESETKGRR